jgi:hypothetical protein
MGSLVANLVLVYRVFDLGVSVTYGSDEIERRGKQADVIQKLFPPLMSNVTRTEIISVAKQLGLAVLDKGDEGLYIGGVQIVFSNEKLTSMSFD